MLCFIDKYAKKNYVFSKSIKPDCMFSAACEQAVTFKERKWQPIKTYDKFSLVKKSYD